MNYSPSTRSTDRKEEKPPHSRIFVVCNKQFKEDDLRPRFEEYGTIEDIYIPRDRNTGESKGVAYIKYKKTSSAALAIQELHMKTINNDSKPMKVMLAINKNGGPTQNEKEDKYRRLFIKVYKDSTEIETRNYFLSFGHVESVHFQRDKQTDACKGFAYVIFKTFYEAALAYEKCDRKYRPMFATPRDDLKRSRTTSIVDNYQYPKQGCDRFSISSAEFLKNEPYASVTPDYNSVVVKCSPSVAKKHIEQIFNLIPTMSQCHYSVDAINGYCTAIITYEDAKYAAYVVDKLNSFQFPSGEILSVKPDHNPLAKAADDLNSIVNSFKNAVDSGTPGLMQLADAIAQASTLIKAATSIKTDSKKDCIDMNFSNLNLPPPQELANINSKVAQRLFMVCKPNPPPLSVLQDVFCRFGDLIDVSTFPNKTFGFVKYASKRAAQEAIKKLNGAMVCGIKLKVLEADEKLPKDEDGKHKNDQSHSIDHNLDNKRMRLND